MTTSPELVLAGAGAAGCVDEDEPHAGVDDDVTGGQLFAKRFEILRFWA